MVTRKPAAKKPAAKKKPAAAKPPNRRGGAPNGVSKEGYPTLALSSGSLEATPVLLEAGADPNQSCDREPTAEALIEASAAVGGVSDRVLWAVARSPVVLRKFLEAGADPNAETRMGRPLNIAVRGGHEEAIGILIDAGAADNVNKPRARSNSSPQESA